MASQVYNNVNYTLPVNELLGMLQFVSAALFTGCLHLTEDQGNERKIWRRCKQEAQLW